MPSMIRAKVPEAMTPELVFLKGGVSLWNYSIPFFTTNVPLAFAEEYFKLFEDLPQADSGEWTLEELFQRDISWERVETDILGYPTAYAAFAPGLDGAMQSRGQSLV